MAVLGDDGALGRTRRHSVGTTLSNTAQRWPHRRGRDIEGRLHLPTLAATIGATAIRTVVTVFTLPVLWVAIHPGHSGKHLSHGSLLARPLQGRSVIVRRHRYVSLLPIRFFDHSATGGSGQSRPPPPWRPLFPAPHSKHEGCASRWVRRRRLHETVGRPGPRVVTSQCWGNGGLQLLNWTQRWVTGSPRSPV